VGPRAGLDRCKNFLLISYYCYCSFCAELHTVSNIVSLVMTSCCLLTVGMCYDCPETNGDHHLLQAGPAFGWGRAGPLPPGADFERGAKKGGHRPATLQYVAL
jgi:hypothetical protein